MIKTHKDLGQNKYGQQEFAQVNWTIDDVLSAAEAAGVQMAEDQAVRFLTQYENQVIDDMCNYAGDAMMYALQNMNTDLE